MGAEGADSRLSKLSARQIDEVRSAVRIAVRSHAELAAVCRRYVDRLGISYAELRQIVDAPLPDYLAGVERNRLTTAGAVPKLKAKQKAALIGAHREALSAGLPTTERRKQLEGFAERFGVRIYVLERVVLADERANRQVYEELRAAGKRLREAEQAQRKAAKARRKAEQALRGGSAGKSRRSVWTVGGGLPGQGKRN